MQLMHNSAHHLIQRSLEGMKARHLSYEATYLLKAPAQRRLAVAGELAADGLCLRRRESSLATPLRHTHGFAAPAALQRAAWSCLNFRKALDFKNRPASRATNESARVQQPATN
jgi:hypothetical protein